MLVRLLDFVDISSSKALRDAAAAWKRTDPTLPSKKKAEALRHKAALSDTAASAAREAEEVEAGLAEWLEALEARVDAAGTGRRGRWGWPPTCR